MRGFGNRDLGFAMAGAQSGVSGFCDAAVPMCLRHRDLEVVAAGVRCRVSGACGTSTSTRRGRNWRWRSGRSAITAGLLCRCFRDALLVVFQRRFAVFQSRITTLQSLLLRQVAQHLEQFAVGARGLVLGAFVDCVTHQLTQLLAVGGRVGFQQFGQRHVAVGEQAFAPALDRWIAATSRRAVSLLASSASRIAARVSSSSRRMCLARNASCRLCAICEVMRLLSSICWISDSGTGNLASCAGVSATSFSPRSKISSASRRCWLRLAPRNSPVSSSRPRIAPTSRNLVDKHLRP